MTRARVDGPGIGRAHDRLRIVLLGGDGGRSGVPRQIRQICAGLAADADLTVISDIDRGGYDFARDTGIAHREIAGLASSADPRRILRAFRGLRAALRDIDPDVIWAHARLTLPLARATLIAARLRRRPLPRLIVTYHGIPFAGRPPLMAALARTTQRLALWLTPPHDIVFIARQDRDAFAGLPLHRHRVHLIPNCSDLGPQPLPGPHPRPRIIMTTRAGRQKNLPAAARIFAHLPADHDLVLLGQGTDTPALRAAFARVLEPAALARVSFAGPVADVAPHLLDADCYLLTSRYEGMPIGALEAFECGLPVAMPGVGGAAEIGVVHPQFARIDPADPAAAARAVAELVAAYRRDPATAARAARRQWQAVFAPAIWERRVRRLLGL